MKRLLLVTLFLVVASMPAYADIFCDTNIDSQPYDQGPYTMCWLSGSICVYCVDFATTLRCAAHQFCDPGARVPQPKYQLARLSPVKSTDRAQVANRRGHTSPTGHSGSNRPVSMRVGKLNIGNLL